MTEREAPEPPPKRRRRSSYWLDGDDINGFNHRAWLKPNGFSDEALLGRPVIGIANTWSELVGCNVHLRSLADAAKRGILQAGGGRSSSPSCRCLRR